MGNTSSNMINSNINSKLNVYVGPMYAGKSTRLIELYEEEVKNLKMPIVLTHSSENRYDDHKLSTHNNRKINCYKYNTIEQFINDKIINIKNNNCVILVDEAQFFDDLLKVIDIVEQYKIDVYVFGLDGDFKRNKFGKVLDLIPFCDNVEKLHNKCNDCDNIASFSHRIINDDSQILVGSHNMYECLCRSCYLKKNVK